MYIIENILKEYPNWKSYFEDMINTVCFSIENHRKTLSGNVHLDQNDL